MDHAVDHVTPQRGTTLGAALVFSAIELPAYEAHVSLHVELVSTLFAYQPAIIAQAVGCGLAVGTRGRVGHMLLILARADHGAEGLFVDHSYAELFRPAELGTWVLPTQQIVGVA